MTKKELKHKLLTIIVDDFYDDVANWQDFLIDTAMEKLKKLNLEKLVEFYSSEPEVVAETLGIEVEELQKLSKESEAI